MSYEEKLRQWLAEGSELDGINKLVLLKEAMLEVAMNMDAIAPVPEKLQTGPAPAVALCTQVQRAVLAASVGGNRLAWGRNWPRPVISVPPAVGAGTCDQPCSQRLPPLHPEEALGARTHCNAPRVVACQAPTARSGLCDPDICKNP